MKIVLYNRIENAHGHLIEDGVELDRVIFVAGQLGYELVYFNGWSYTDFDCRKDLLVWNRSVLDKIAAISNVFIYQMFDSATLTYV